MPKSDLRIDWATHEAAKYACEAWHYSKSVPVPPLVKVGAWENSKFIGVVIFSRGANNNLLKPFGLCHTEGCELTRVALSNHKSTVSRVIRLALLFLKKNSPELRLVVSFADPSEGHHGGVYQAGNWIYTGRQPPTVEYIAPDGKQWHGRMVSKDGRIKVQGKYRACWRIDQCTPVEKPGKHRYLMPLDEAMKAQIMPLAKPYPKRQASEASSDAPAIQAGEGGAAPTLALHHTNHKHGV
jgi:hypothetical protein